MTEVGAKKLMNFLRFGCGEGYATRRIGRHGEQVGGETTQAISLKACQQNAD